MRRLRTIFSIRAKAVQTCTQNEPEHVCINIRVCMWHRPYKVKRHTQITKGSPSTTQPGIEPSPSILTKLMHSSLYDTKAEIPQEFTICFGLFLFLERF